MRAGPVGAVVVPPFAWQLCVGGVALTALDCGNALGSRLAMVAASVCVTGVALGDGDLRFAWQAWRIVQRVWIWYGVDEVNCICISHLDRREAK